MAVISGNFPLKITRLEFLYKTKKFLLESFEKHITANPAPVASQMVIYYQGDYQMSLPFFSRQVSELNCRA